MLKYFLLFYAHSEENPALKFPFKLDIFSSMESIRRFIRQVLRVKTLNFEYFRYRDVPRYKSLLHLLVQGLGSGNAIGVYVFISTAARVHSGPAIVLSALIVGLTAWIVGSCYSELSCRIPLMGASYLFAYSVFGEFVAFLIGWNDLLTSFITLALTAQTLTHHLNVLSGERVDSWMRKDLGVVPWDHNFTPDIVACFSILLCGFAVCRCKNLSLTVIVCLFVLHMLIIIAMVFLSLFHVKAENWGSDENFFQSGMDGIIAGAVTLMPSFSGISGISMAGEEVRKPSRNIPIAHIMVVVVSFVLLFLLSALVTLSTPVANLSLHAPLLNMFEDLQVKNSKYLIGIGCMSGLTLAIVVQLQNAERLLYAMTRDKLLPHRLAIWHFHRGSPWLCRFIVVGVSALLALLIPFRHLLTQVSIDILISFAATCLAVVVVRYDPCQLGLEKGNPLRKTVSAESFVLSQASSCISQASYSTAHSHVSHSINPTLQKTETAILLTQDKATSTQYSTQRFTNDEPKGTTEDSPDSSDEGLLPDLQSYQSVLRTLYLTVTMSLIFAALTRFGWRSMEDPFGWVILTFCLLCVFVNFCGALYISRAPTTHKEQVYTAGGVPFLQILAVMGLCVMLFSVDSEAWIRWMIWTSIGTIFYLSYSRTRSAECLSLDQAICFENPTVSHTL